MENSTLSHHEEVWEIGECSLRHSLDANGDLSTLDFDINILSSDDERWRAVRLVPRALFPAMVESCFEPVNSLAIDGPDNEYIGTFNVDEPEQYFAILRSSQDAIHRMAQLITVHREIYASIEIYSLPDRSAGLITGFLINSIDVRPG